MRLDVTLPVKYQLRHKVHSCPAVMELCNKSAKELDEYTDDIKSLKEAKELLKVLTKMVVHLHNQSKKV